MTGLCNDEKAGKRGFISVAYGIGQDLPIYSTTGDELSIMDLLPYVPLFDSFPGKETSKHYCVSHSSVVTMMNYMIKQDRQENRRRIQLHTGSHVEVQYKLMSYGISETLFLIDKDGNVKQDYVDLWIEKQRRREHQEKEKLASTTFMTISATAPTSTAIANACNNLLDDGVATDKDVLLGRGVPIQLHPGNLRLAKMIEDRFNEYLACDKLGKTVLTWEIVRMTQADGGRFLERDHKASSASQVMKTTTDAFRSATTTAGGAGNGLGRWQVCSDEQARYKVAYGFRTHIKLLRKKKKKST